MAKKNVLVDIDLNKNELQNAVIQNLAAAPANLVAGQIWYNTTDNLIYFYDGTSSKAVGYLPPATTSSLGGVIVGTNISVDNTGKISVASASNASAGIIRIATDSESTTGTAEGIAVNPKQLATKVTGNAAITGGTATKITYDAKGLVTAGTTLSTSDIPDLSSTYVAKTLIGAANGVAGLGSDGKVPTAQLPSFVDDVIDAYIVSGSTPLSAGWLSKTSGGSALTPETGIIYVVLTTGEYLNKTYRWSGTTYVEISSSPAQATESAAGIAAIATQAECTTGTNDTKFVTPLKMATYTSGMVKTTATQTLTNKTIDADDNTIQDLTTSNFKSGTVVTTVGPSSGSGAATDSQVPTALAVRNAIDTKASQLPQAFIYANPALTSSGGVCTWTITHSGKTALSVSVREDNGGAEVMCDVSYADGSTTIKINSASNIAAYKYVALMVSVSTGVL